MLEIIIYFKIHNRSKVYGYFLIFNKIYFNYKSTNESNSYDSSFYLSQLRTSEDYNATKSINIKYHSSFFFEYFIYLSI